MRLILRFLGTWLLGLALVLLIVDGTKSLGASALVITSLREIWVLVHAQSLTDFMGLIGNFGEGLVLAMLETTLLKWPAWAVAGVPGLIFALIGRSRTSRVHNLEHM